LRHQSLKTSSVNRICWAIRSGFRGFYAAFNGKPKATLSAGAFGLNEFDRACFRRTIEKNQHRLDDAGRQFFFGTGGGARSLFAGVWQQSHESRPFDCFGYGMLADCGTASFASTHDFSVTVHKLLQQVQILVVHVHRARTFATDKQGILTDGFGF
jgi:hypothetical protein